jgi:purine-binding chemotaxis protein CheW
MSNSFTPYLLFSVNSTRYGVETMLVQEIFSLPELTPIADAPHDIVGVVNLRSQIVPVMDINLRLHYQTLEYKISDTVIILDWKGLKIGIIVNEVQQVENIPESAITNKIIYGRDVQTKSNRQYISGIAQVGKELVTLLNTEQLILYVDSQELESTEEIITDEIQNLSQQRVFCPQATPEEKIIFRQRAENLMISTEKQDLAGLISLAIVGLNGEYFGIDLKLVQEFTDLRKITPIPCCPPHIIGNMNLRGEILTLVDLRHILSIENNEKNAPKVMIVKVDDLVIGIAIEEVLDITYIKPSQIMPVPAAVHSINHEYLYGTATYKERVISVLELEKVFNQGSLIVDEEV